MTYECKFPNLKIIGVKFTLSTSKRGISILTVSNRTLNIYACSIKTEIFVPPEITSRDNRHLTTSDQILPHFHGTEQ